MWFLMQILPEKVMAPFPNFWKKLAKVFERFKTIDLERYISDMVHSIKRHFIRMKIEQTKVPIAIDETHVAIGINSNIFHSTTSNQQRSCVTMLLQTAMDQPDTCTILAGTGLMIDDLRNGIFVKNIGIMAGDVISITGGFNDINENGKMAKFLSQFLGPLTQQQMELLSCLQGRYQFAVKFLEKAFSESKKPSSNMDEAIRGWLDETVKDLIGQLKIVERMYQDPSVWPIVENIIIEWYMFSREQSLNTEEAFAVETVFAQLNRVGNTSANVVTVAGFSEPKGKYFERYLIDPFCRIFHKKKGDILKLIAGCRGDIKQLKQLLSHDITIHRLDKSIYYKRGSSNLCEHGDLHSFLNNPQVPFFMPEAAGPDLVFVIEIHVPESDEPVLVPVFIQAKFRCALNNVGAAIASTSPKTFYKNERPRMKKSCEEKRNAILECLKDKYKSLSIGFMISHSPISRKIYSTYNDKTLTIIIDPMNAKQFFGENVLEELRGLKSKQSSINQSPTNRSPNKRQRTLEETFQNQGTLFYQ